MRVMTIWGLPGTGGLSGVLVLVVLVLAAVVTALAGVREIWTRLWHGRPRVRLGLLLRVRWRMWPGPGWARRWHLWRQHGRPAARRVARNARPSLTWAQRRFGPVREYASFIGWAQGWLWRWRVYSHLESLTLTIAAPQEGKSQAAACSILDAPGPVVATSIRGDLIRTTAALRAQRGQVHVWNPEGIGDYGSTFRVNIVAGCEEIETAVRRGGAMVESQPATGRGDDSFWNAQAGLVLGAYLHAAALAGGTASSVYRWISKNDPAPIHILGQHPGASEESREIAAMYIGLPERTRAGVMTTLTNTLKFMISPACVEAVTADSGGFDFGRFIWGKDTLYLVASDGAGSPVTPLFLLICSELAHAARTAGAASRPARPPHGPLLGMAWPGAVLDALFPARTAKRLDPPLRMVLDELPNTAPVPVERWASWAAGSGLQLYLITQAWAQLAKRYGEEGAHTVWQCCKTKVIYGGGTEKALCELVEQMCGEAEVRVTERWPADRRGGGPWWVPGRHHRNHRRERVNLLPAADLRQLPRTCAVVLSDHGRPVIVRTEQVRKRRDVRRAQRRGLTVGLPAPAPRPVPVADATLLGGTDQRPARPQAPQAVPDQLAVRRAGRARRSGGLAEEFAGLGLLPDSSGDTGDGGQPAPIRPTIPAPWERPASGGEDK